MAELWGQWYGENEGPRIRLLPGEVAALKRAEALERAAQQREEDERRDRAETRREIWRMERMRALSFRGVPFDPGDDRTLVQPLSDFVEESFRSSDLEAEREHQRALRDAGLLHDLGPSFAGDVGPASGPSSAGSSVPASAARSKATAFFHRFKGTQPCMCANCVAVRVGRV